MAKTIEAPFSSAVRAKLASNLMWGAGGVLGAMIFWGTANDQSADFANGRIERQTIVRNNIATTFEKDYMPLTQKLTFDEIKSLGQTNEAIGFFSGCLQDQWNATTSNVTIENNILSVPSSTVALDKEALYACFVDANVDAATLRYDNSADNSAAFGASLLAVFGAGLAGINGLSGASTVIGNSAAWLRNRKDQKATAPSGPEAPSA